MTSATLGWSSPSLPMATTPGDGERRGMGVRQPAEIEPVSIDYVTAQQANPQRTGQGT